MYPDPTQTGGVITKQEGDRLAKNAGYDDEESNADGSTSVWKDNARKVLEEAKKKFGAGSGKGQKLIDLLGDLLYPQADWKALLKKYIGDALAPEKEPRMPNRRFLSQGSYRYTEKKKMNALEKVIVLVDVSGSMGRDTIENILGEINGIIFSNRVKEVIVAFFDDGVDKKSVQKVTAMNKPYVPGNVPGGGGTNFQKALDWVKDTYNDKVSLCVFMTDGICNMPKKPKYDKKFIWFVYDDMNFKHPFGRAVLLNTKRLKI
jgi:predicted metal-dependent peptidase